MMLAALVAVLMAVGAAGAKMIEITHEQSSVAQMQEHIDALQHNVHFDTKHPPHMRLETEESACALYVLSTMCLSFTFVDERMMLPARKPRPGDGSSARIYHGLFVYDETDWFNATVFVKREVLRRARNTLSTPISLTREKSSVVIDSTTEGWTVGAQLTGGYFGLPGGGAGGMGSFAQAGVTVSGSYSSQRTTGTHVSVSDVSSFSCPSKYVCRSELWTTYVKVSGVCQTHPRFVCGSYTVDPCATDESFRCQQIDEWRDRMCRLDERVQACDIIVPVMETGDKPYVVEVFFEDPIPSLFDKPRITGYQAGVYILDSADYHYDPDRKLDPYWTRERGWHSDKVFPTLDTSEYQHKVPQVLDCKSGKGGMLYKLDTEEWYWPSKQGNGTDSKCYYVESKGWYAKPTAPLPTQEDLDECDARLASNRPSPGTPA
ncbi:hypothetical protein CDD83_3268 [Cordyceps sp. RAO-2017]|nr:hypothetical protein CDD83_3268 [Cordyceps sp. RAO-2017]